MVAALRGGRRLRIEIEATGPLAAQDEAEIALGRRHFPVVEMLGSIERVAPRTMPDDARSAERGVGYPHLPSGRRVSR